MFKKILPLLLTLFCIICVFLILPTHSQARTGFGTYLLNSHYCTTENSHNILITKNHGIDPEYIPSDLLELDNLNIRTIGQEYLRQEAASYFRLLQKTLDKKFGQSIYVASGYRSFDHQLNVYQNWSKVLGVSAQRRSALAGHSEHQLGTAVDLTLTNGKPLYQNGVPSPEWVWLKDNAHRFGFTMSYRIENETTTGYDFEPWHWRFVGVNLATKIYATNSLPEKLYQRKNCNL